MEKALAPHSSTLAWKIPWMEKPGRLQSMGSRRVRHDWATSLSLFTFMHWRRKWQPTPVFLPGESQGQRSLVDCHLWDRTELDMTERLSCSSSIRLYICHSFVPVHDILTTPTYRYLIPHVVFHLTSMPPIKGEVCYFPLWVGPYDSSN